MAIALSGSAEVVAVGTTLRHQGLAAVSLHKGDLLAETSSSPPPKDDFSGREEGGEVTVPSRHRRFHYSTEYQDPLQTEYAGDGGGWRLGEEEEEEEEEKQEEKRDGNAQLTCKICLTECVFQATPSVWLEGEEPSPEVLESSLYSDFICDIY